jgi:hypothetical protein
MKSDELLKTEYRTVSHLECIGDIMSGRLTAIRSTVNQDLSILLGAII